MPPLRFNSEKILSPPPGNCVLLFSGGRDSSLAVPRLLKNEMSPILITITNNHLGGIDRVYQRLEELLPILPKNSRWWRVKVDSSDLAIPILRSNTCLPCQSDYVATSCIIAKKFELNKIALGYAYYQNDFPEQSPIAVKLLDNMLSKNGYELHLPVYNIKSKEEAKMELIKYGMTEKSMEQKCARQINNIVLDKAALEMEAINWVNRINLLIRNPEQFSIEILEGWATDSSGWNKHA